MPVSYFELCWTPVAAWSLIFARQVKTAVDTEMLTHSRFKMLVAFLVPTCYEEYVKNVVNCKKNKVFVHPYIGSPCASILYYSLCYLSML